MHINTHLIMSIYRWSVWWLEVGSLRSFEKHPSHAVLELSRRETLASH